MKLSQNAPRSSLIDLRFFASSQFNYNCGIEDKADKASASAGKLAGDYQARGGRSPSCRLLLNSPKAPKARTTCGLGTWAITQLNQVPLLAVALLKFFAAAAGTGIVAADFWRFASDRHSGQNNFLLGLGLSHGRRTSGGHHR